MKNISRILGIVLALSMVLTMAVSVAPTKTAEAALTNLQFVKVPLPKYSLPVGTDTTYVLSPNTDIGTIAVAPNGSTLFASANITETTAFNMNDLLKSDDKGYTWAKQDAFRTTANASAWNSDITPIVAIGISPEYDSDASIFVATQNLVYTSVDGGKAFTSMLSAWTAAERITSMDVTLDKTGRLSVIVGTKDAAGINGDVYVYSPATTGMGWKVQRVNGSSATAATKSLGVLAVAFSPNYASDEGIFAITNNITTTLTRIQSSFGNTKDGGGWGSSIGPGKFLDKNGAEIDATSACIDFPDDFDIDSITNNIAFVGLYAGTPDGLNTTELGDVFKVTLQSSNSNAVDLNVRGIVSVLSPTTTNIVSIDVSGPAAAADIVVGTDFFSISVNNYYWLTYYSQDSGATWSSAREKSPTGGNGTWLNSALTSGASAGCAVAMAADFDTSGIVYAATKGIQTSAISRSTDGAASFTQISIIDYSFPPSGNYTMGLITAVGSYSTANTFWMTTTASLNLTGLADNGGTMWKTTNAGANYERIWSYANPSTSTKMSSLKVTGDNVIAYDLTLGKFWYSTDGGKSFPRTVIAKQASITKATIPSFSPPNSIFTAYGSGVLWYTHDLGRPWVQPENSEISGTPDAVSNSGNNTFTVANTDGKLFISTDRGVTFKRVGVTDLGGAAKFAFASDYATSKIIYAAMTASGGGVWKTVVDEANPHNSEWKRIDAASTVGLTAVTASGILYTGGVLYVFDTQNVTTGNGAGGLWRCVNPNDDPNGIYPPVFARMNAGLATNDRVSWNVGISGTPTTLFFTNGRTDSAATNYYNTLLYFADTLASPIALVSPADKASGQGVRLNTEDLRMTVTLTWTAAPGATLYQYQVANDASFNSVVATANLTGQSKDFMDLLPGKTYYWRVQAISPMYSPWSAGRYFTVTQAELLTAVELLGPAPGAYDVPLKPTFTWKPVAGALGYHVQLASDPNFTAFVEMTPTPPTGIFLKVNAWKPENDLEYSTTYYWRVRAQLTEGPSTYTAYSVGVFTTMAEPTTTTPTVTQTAPPEIVEVPTPAAIPVALLWAIVAIGAILVIALIVLIVRTRRVS